MIMRINFIRNSDFLDSIFSSLSLLEKSKRRKIKLVSAGQTLLGFLDLLGIAAIGLVATVGINGINSRPTGGVTYSLLRSIGLSSLSLQFQAAVLATFALMLFILRTLLSMFLTRKTLFFLGRCGAEISSDLFRKILTRPIIEIEKYGSQQYVYFLTAGVEILVVRIIGSTVSLIADIALLFLIITALLYVDFLMTMLVIIIVSAMFLLLHRLTTSRSKVIGMEHSSRDISSRESLFDALSAFREIVTKGRIPYYESKFRKSRSEAAGALAEYNFMPYMGKYVIETSIMLSAFLIAGVQFLISDALNAITTLSIFMAAGSRLAPAVLRIQQGFVRINNGRGAASSTLSLIEELELVNSPKRDIKKFSESHSGFVPKIELSNVIFRYPKSSTQTLEAINLDINPGESIALVGPSGSGKSTLVDLITGVLIPDGGEVKLSGVSPREAILRWPGAVGYVPQQIYISNSSVAQNVALGYSEAELDDSQIWHALEVAQIADFVSTIGDGLTASLGDRGVKLSGGQKQRLGIARALLTKPHILILDEATSALDGQTEQEVAHAIDRFKGQITLIFIAHRLSTAKRADRIIYLESGKVVAQGSFAEVQKAVPKFQKVVEMI